MTDEPPTEDAPEVKGEEPNESHGEPNDEPDAPERTGGAAAEADDGESLDVDETLAPGTVSVSDGPTPPGAPQSSDTAGTPESDADHEIDPTFDQETAMETPEESTTGERQYTYTHEIGAGAFGTVYKGRDENLERVVAIKKIRNVFDVFAQIEREDVVERFQRLIRAQAEISHPAVIQIYDLETNEEYPFAVTEYAPNGNLRSRIEDDEQRKLSYALESFVQILHGMHAAHRRDLVHGNVKPENVLFDAAGNAKLSDFGLTTIVDLDEEGTEQISVAVGAPEYKAPEQIKTGQAGTAQSDIYALGILFYEMLTGEIPSRRSPMPSEKHPEVPSAVDDIFDRMSLDDPADRYESVEEVLADLYSSEKIVRQMDRRSGVIHLADPVEHGRRPAVDSDAHLRASSEGTAVSPIEATGRGGGSRDEERAEPTGRRESSSDEDTPEPSSAVSDSPTAADGGLDADPASGGQEDSDSDDEEFSLDTDPYADDEDEESSWGLF